MWFPVDPGDDATLWASFAAELATAPLCHVVAAASGDPGARARSLDQLGAASIAAAFQSAEAPRLGVSRRRAVAPHAAFAMRGPDAVLTELLIPPSGATDPAAALANPGGAGRRANAADVARHVEALVTAFLYGPPARGRARPAVEAVRVPLALHVAQPSDVVAEAAEPGWTVLRRAPAAPPATPELSTP